MTAQVQGDLLTTAVNHDGLIQAQGVEQHNGGVYLVRTGGDVNIAGTIDVDATVSGAAGGRVIVLSDGNIAVREGATLTAQGSGSGGGGVIRLIADELLDVESLSTIDASGGATGQGGFIEVSGHQGINLAGTVNTGPEGQLLFDPAFIEIISGTGSPFVITTTGGEITHVPEFWIEGHLNAGTHLALIASSGIYFSGGSDGPVPFTGEGIDATGNGDLTLGIGQINGAGGLDDFFSTTNNVACTSGICEANGGSYGFAPGNGFIDFIDEFDFVTPVNVNINGDLNIYMQSGWINLPASLTANNITIGAPSNSLDGVAAIEVYSDLSTVTIDGKTSVNVNEVWSPPDGGRLNIRGGDLTIRDSFIFYWPSFSTLPGVIDIQISGTAKFIDSVIYGESLIVSAGGDILLDGDDGTVTVPGEITGTYTPEIGSEFGPLVFQAGGSIRVNYATDIYGYGVTMVAGNLIDLTLASPHVGVFEGFSLSQYGDPTMLSQLASLGVSVPSSSVPNGVFIAPEINFGLLEFRGDYLYLKSDRLTFTQNVATLDPSGSTINQDVIVQMLPYTSNRSIVIEGSLAGGIPPLLGSTVTYYTQADHFGRFPGTSLLIGGSSFAGPMFIGQNGTVNIGSKNFLGLTFGQVIGANNIQTTGLFSIQGASPLSVTTLVQQTTTNPTDTTTTTITEETVDANLPSEEQTGTDDTPLEEPFDFIALLEEQPLVDGQIESNGMVLACR
jgi:hypothetical protein